MDAVMGFLVIILVIVVIAWGLIRAAGVGSNDNSTHKTNSQTTATITKIDKLTDEAKTHLASDEEIIGTIEGLIGTVILREISYGDLPAIHRNKTIDTHNGILLATTSRVVIYKPKRGGSEIKFVSYSNISGIETRETGSTEYSLVFSAEETIAVKHINRDLAKAVKRVADYVRSRMGESTEETTSIPEQIQQLANLKDQGILTEEEFNAKKQVLLDRL